MSFHEGRSSAAAFDLLLVVGLALVAFPAAFFVVVVVVVVVVEALFLVVLPIAVAIVVVAFCALVLGFVSGDSEESADGGLEADIFFAGVIMEAVLFISHISHTVAVLNFMIVDRHVSQSASRPQTFPFLDISNDSV